MNELRLVKSERFGEIEADIYSNGEDMFMTINQLAACLEYADKSGVEKLVQRNSYLSKPEFSTTDKLSVVEGGRVVNRNRAAGTIAMAAGYLAPGYRDDWGFSHYGHDLGFKEAGYHVYACGSGEVVAAGLDGNAPYGSGAKLGNCIVL